MSIAPRQATRERRSAEQALIQAEYERSESLEPYRESLQSALASVKEARRGRLQGMVRAPIAGTVVALNVREGEPVGDRPEIPLVSIINLNRLQVQAPVPPEYVADADAGTPVALQFEKAPNQTYQGMILRLTTTADETGQVTSCVAVIGFDNRDDVVRPGQKARASIRTGSVRDVVAVPAEAVDMGDKRQPYVEVHRAGRWLKQPVTVGLSDGAYTEIRASSAKARPSASPRPHRRGLTWRPPPALRLPHRCVTGPTVLPRARSRGSHFVSGLRAPLRLCYSHGRGRTSMTIRVELTPEDEARLRERAAVRGESPEALAAEMLHALLLHPPVNGTVGGLRRVVDEHGVFHQDRWEAVMASIARGSANAPVLPPEALTREGLYQDHD